MKKILFCLCLVMLIGCAPKQNLDPNQWEIPIDSIKNVVIESKEHGGKVLEPFEISKDEGIQLIEAFNNIEYIEKWEDPDNLFSNLPIHVIVDTKYGEIDFGCYDLPLVYYKGECYRFELTHEFGDIVREIQSKYNLVRLEFWRNPVDLVNQWLDKSSGIFHVNLNVNKALEALGFKERIDPDMTMQDILDTYEGNLELNCVVKYENMEVKVIEMKDNQATAIIFTWHER